MFRFLALLESRKDKFSSAVVFNSYDVELRNDAFHHVLVYGSFAVACAAAGVLPVNEFLWDKRDEISPAALCLSMPDFLGSYSMPGIALPSLPTLSRAVSPASGVARHTQQQHHHFLYPFHNPLEHFDHHHFYQRPPILQCPSLSTISPPNKCLRRSSPMGCFPPSTRSARPWAWDIAVYHLRRLCL